MKKYLLIMFFAVSTMVSLNSCIVSEDKLSDKIQTAIIDDELAKGNTLEVTNFELNKTEGKNYIGVLKGTLNGKEVIYDIKVADEGSDLDVDWEQRK